ncbi:hypothetical protein DERF_014468 [Dermatophagoides farinae]|uniref:Uncharacterized protein n=1 Tax=Dermatophagoides farinae TaxID=6954 RepID=A0A922HMC6_DERFA|nr:hypothetical protein DERF_014468 [Dermatophagoides farinae]
MTASSSSSSCLLFNSSHNNRPQLPKKSSFVRRKIQTNYNNDDNYENLPEMNQNRIESTTNTLNRHHTSRSLPPLIMDTKASTLPRPPKSIVTSTAINNNKGSSSNNNKLDLTENSSKKIINYSQNIDYDDDDDGCDYEYDYVCLESKKKLDDDDERIKMLLSNQYQFRYENLVFQSNSFVLPSSSSSSSSNHFQSSSITTNIQSMKQFYRRHIFQAQRNFYQWTRLAIEIINHRQYKPEVYFNFVKHILLAGQNLLNTFKLFIRKWQQQQQQFDHKSSSSSSSSASAKELDKFSIKFLDQLKQIVMKTKRLTFAAAFGNKAMDDLVEHLQLASEMSDSVRKMFTI